DNDDEDPYITRIKRSGCYDEHIALQDCHWDTKDWRLCRQQMSAFKRCMSNHS
ncbi:uncharacterized protein BJ171DRAFT_412547, partial [Polychytrium aggregatum]|uniref:uncharacterized protein n=1 Tax=Polychytrium aggregatum TaxID=110093 RepID=UPI0022FDF629